MLVLVESMTVNRRYVFVESLGMALQKVDQTQLEILKLGDLTDSNRKRLEDLHRFAEEERVCQANDV